MAAPSLLPELDVNGTRQPADPNGIPQATKDDGFREIEAVETTSWNWLFKIIHDWLKYFKDAGAGLFDVEHNTSTGEHTDVDADSVDVSGFITTQRSVSGGVQLLVGGSTGFEEITGVGASSTDEEVAQSIILAANALDDETVMQVKATGFLARNTGSVTLRVRIGDDATVSNRSALMSWVFTPSSNGEFLIEVEARVKTPGASLDLDGYARGVMEEATPNSPLHHFDGLGWTPADEDGTVSLTVSLTVEYSLSDASNYIDSRYMTVAFHGGS